MSVHPDVSMAPEIARLMEPTPAEHAALAPASAPAAMSTGDLARELKRLTASPDRWWSLVHFDAEHPVHAGIPTVGAHEAWLSILPPSAASHDESDVLTVLAGELTEPASLRPLLPGQVRVHGAPGPRRAVNTSDGYTVSVHLRARPGQ